MFSDGPKTERPATSAPGMGQKLGRVPADVPEHGGSIGLETGMAKRLNAGDFFPRLFSWQFLLLPSTKNPRTEFPVRGQGTNTLRKSTAH